MQFYGIYFMHPYKHSGHWQDVLLIWMHETNAIKLLVQVFLRKEHLDVRNISKTL